MSKRCLNIATLILATCATVCMSAASYAAYPEKPVKIVVPWEAGGSADMLGRLVAERLGKYTGQSFVVENKPGASGNIGTQQVARSAPDGYTLVLGSMSTHILQPAIGLKGPFQPIDDFTPIARLGFITNVLAVRSELPVSSAGELIDAAKKQPEGLTYASAGNGSFNHLSGALFEQLAGIRLLHVPYKGGSKAALSTASAETDVVFSSLGLVKPYVDSGKLKILAVAEGQASPLLPGVPTVADVAPGYRVSVWYALLGPKGLPQDVTAALDKAMHDLNNDSEIRSQLARNGFDLNVETGETFKEEMRSDTEQWTEFSRKHGIAP
ncbi:hypothetical protein CAP48_17905 [Advenella sp. S44]|uniref:Tripartite tricarboxylate transporter substrate binding protein n=1 Tax=Advenella kashmirensis TaxID=310575 RepID=A0A356LAT4_9BURK|nr:MULTISPECIES: tripartite tricarboxylate transporter substrate binding protein [unclassified Advenella]PJX20290.1 hypothetical protein CAP48_17905 [Advenella sp. S44]HBP28103.1 tripartite tricarboxylate transporter substrate binding protein [Advenella kashmirensis]